MPLQGFGRRNTHCKSLPRPHCRVLVEQASIVWRMPSKGEHVCKPGISDQYTLSASMATAPPFCPPLLLTHCHTTCAPCPAADHGVPGHVACALTTVLPGRVMLPTGHRTWMPRRHGKVGFATDDLEELEQWCTPLLNRFSMVFFGVTTS